MVHSDSDDGTPMKHPPQDDQLAAKNHDDDANDSHTPTKSMYRKMVWGSVKSLYGEGSGKTRYVKRQVPLFPEAREAADRLAETPEFKEAKNIKVNINLAQETVKLHVLNANKTLFVAPTQKSEYLYAKIKTSENVVLDFNMAGQRSIVKMMTGKDKMGGDCTYEKLGIDQAEPLDMVVVGCVAVSERGQVIGKGNGYVDLEIAVLHSLGVITPKTVIATTVADQQVHPEFPAELFQNYDFTVDLIVTPTRVIRVEPRPELRTIGVQWGLLSPRQLRNMRVLKPLKKRLEDEGQKIELKEEDTDVESFAKRGMRGNGDQQKRRQKRNKNWRTARKYHGDEPEPEPNLIGNGKPVPRSTGNGGGEQSQRRERQYKVSRARQQKPSSRPQRQLKPQLQDGVRIRVSNMFYVPFKEFKEELRNRDCYPAKISQSRNGRCLLIFPKCDDTEEQMQADELLQKLADMRISVPQKNSTELKEIKLKCELQPKSREFDESNATSVTSAAKRAAKKAAEACAKLANNTTTTTDTDPDATTNTAMHLNVDELAAEVNAATLLAARAAKAAEAIAQKVLQETKPAIDVENEKEDNKEHTAKLIVQVETLIKAGADVLSAGKKAEAAAAANATTTTGNETENTSANDTEATSANDTETTGANDKETTTPSTADAPVTESAASKKEAITAMNDAIQEAARATAAVSFAVATLYQLLPSRPAREQTVTVASVQTLTRLFGALLPKVTS